MNRGARREPSSKTMYTAHRDAFLQYLAQLTREKKISFFNKTAKKGNHKGLPLQ
jgi:hypothetical protein